MLIALGSLLGAAAQSVLGQQRDIVGLSHVALLSVADFDQAARF